jgi:hypothetical protein
MRQTQGAASQSKWALDARSCLKIRQRLRVLKTGFARIASRDHIGALLGLAFWNVFAEYALVALDPPLTVGAILKPLGDTRLGMNLAIHHGDAGLVTVGDNFFQADLAVAQ